MANRFIGQGWSFPVAPDGAGHITASSDEAKIRQSIWTILSTAPGERVMRSDFGCGIQTLIFEHVHASMLGRVAGEVTSALTRWESRIDVLGVDVRPDEKDPSVLLILLEYRIRSANSRHNLVYPFYVS